MGVLIILGGFWEYFSRQQAEEGLAQLLFAIGLAFVFPLLSNLLVFASTLVLDQSWPTACFSEHALEDASFYVLGLYGNIRFALYLCFDTIAFTVLLRNTVDNATTTLHRFFQQVVILLFIW